MKILLAYDGSIYADAAIEDMRRAGLPNNAEALVVCVANYGLHPPRAAGTEETTSPESQITKLDEANSLVQDARNRLHSYFPQWVILSEVLWGYPAEVILRIVDDWKPDLLIAGSHGRLFRCERQLDPGSFA